MEEIYDMTHINSNLIGPFTIISTVNKSINFTANDLNLNNVEKVIQESDKE